MAKKTNIRKSRIKKDYTVALTAWIALPVALVLYQNCAPIWTMTTYSEGLPLRTPQSEKILKNKCQEQAHTSAMTKHNKWNLEEEALPSDCF